MNAPLRVIGIDHVVFHVKDLARARKFYVDFLGLQVEHERDWLAARIALALFRKNPVALISVSSSAGSDSASAAGVG